jgi:hypothetical protein
MLCADAPAANPKSNNAASEIRFNSYVLLVSVEANKIAQRTLPRLSNSPPIFSPAISRNRLPQFPRASHPI